MGLNRGPWTPEEDDLLVKYIQKHGEGGWRTLPKKAGLLRCGKSCRLRWMNYLRPDVKRGQILPDEEDLILRLHRLLGNRWSLIAGRMPGRTDNEIKNYWNTHLSKKLISEGIDPRTHKPLAESELELLRSDKSQGVDNVNSEDTNNPTSDSQKIQLQETETAMSDNIESCKVVDNIGHSPELSKNVNDHPDTSAIDSLHTVANSSSTAKATQSTYIGSEGTYSSAVSDLGKGSGKLPQQSVNGAVHVNQPSQIPYCYPNQELSLEGHDWSPYLRTNTVTSSFFMAPPSGLDSAPHFSDQGYQATARNALRGGHQYNESFSANFIQHRAATEETHQESYKENDGANSCTLQANINPLGPITEDCNSDILSYFLESFMTEDQLLDEANYKHATPASASVSQHVQHLSQAQAPNHDYDMWSVVSPSSQYPSN